MVKAIEYARLANEVYEPHTKAVDQQELPGWHRVKGMYKDDTSVFQGGALTSSGLQGRAFFHPRGDLVIAFKGTKITMASDLVADIKIAAYMVPTQATEAVRLVKNWKARYPKWRVSLAGHSLGGAICQIAGLATDTKFVTFGAPGMHHNAIGLCAFKKLWNTSKAGVNYANVGDMISWGHHIGRTEWCYVGVATHRITKWITYLECNDFGEQDPLALL